MKKKTAEIISPLVKFMWDDMNRNTEILLEVSKKIEFEKGRKVGYAEGFKAAQNNMRKAMFDVQLASGMIEYKEVE